LYLRFTKNRVMLCRFSILGGLALVAREHLKRIGEIVDEPGVADGDGADMASETEEATEASVLETCHTETAASPDYFSF
jgi:hypothetical protein